MARRDASPDFIEALARGLDVIRAFRPHQPVMSLTAVATRPGWPGPPPAGCCSPWSSWATCARPAGVSSSPPGLDLGMTYVLSRNLWDVARPHMECLVARTHESSSIAQLDGPDIVYVARVAVPKIIALAVTIGTRFPAMPTSLGKVLLAALPPGAAEQALAEPSRSGDHRPLAARAGRAGGGAARGAGPGLVAHGRAARGGDPVGGRPAAGRGREGDRGAERDRARRGNPAGDPHRRIPAAPAPGGWCDQRGLGTLPVGTARHRPAGRAP